MQNLKQKQPSAGAKGFPCEICGNFFAFKGKWMKHQLVHSDAKDYKCDECNKCFNTKWSLKRHQLLHCNFRCQICDQNFRHKHALLDHQSSHSYKCERCGQLFQREYDPAEQEQSRSGADHMRCEQCSKHFLQHSVTAFSDLVQEKELGIQTKCKLSAMIAPNTDRGLKPIPRSNLLREEKTVAPQEEAFALPAPAPPAPSPVPAYAPAPAPASLSGQSNFSSKDGPIKSLPSITDRRHEVAPIHRGRKDDSQQMTVAYIDTILNRHYSTTMATAVVCAICNKTRETSFWLRCCQKHASGKQECNYWVHQWYIGLYYENEIALGKVPFYCSKHGQDMQKLKVGCPDN